MGTFKAENIKDQEIYALIQQGVIYLHSIQSHFHAIQQIPVKVTLAKLKQMHQKGRIKARSGNPQKPWGISTQFAMPDFKEG